MPSYVIYSISNQGKMVELDRVNADRIVVQEGFTTFIKNIEFGTELVASITPSAPCYIVVDKS